jgi:hypothetical protein
LHGGAKLELTGSIIKEQGVTFAVVVVKEHVVNNRSEAEEAIRSFQAQIFRGLPVVLMSQDARGIPRYFGRSDLSKFLANVDPRRIPWKKYTIH